MAIEIQLMKTGIKSGLLMLMAGLMLLSCTPSHYLAPKEYLLVKNKVSLDKPVTEISELQGFMRQKPNKSFLGIFRPRIWAYQYASQNRETGFKKWIMRSYAEKPVALDTQNCNLASRHMRTYLNNIGYFKSQVIPEIIYKKKFAKVTYRVMSGPPSIIRSYQRYINDDTLRAICLAESENSLVKTGAVYNAYTLADERDRITLALRNQGYYQFSKEYISYLVDSIPGKDLIDIKFFLSDPAPPQADTLSTVQQLKHKTFRIRKVNIYPDYNPMQQNQIQFDSLEYKSGKEIKNKLERTYTFYFANSLNIRPKAITQNLFLVPGELFRLDDIDQTYNRLSDLQYYRFVNIAFSPVKSIPANAAESQEWIDCNIQLTRNKLSVISTGSEGTNKGGDFGIAANILYENRNLFRGAELLNVRLKGAMEVQKRFVEIYSSAENYLFNTFETGIQADLVFPKFLIPVNQERFSRNFRPKTTLNAGVNYQQRSSFTRYLMEVSFGYEWRESQHKRHLLIPIDINSVSIFPDSTFTSYLDTLNDKRLRDQYTDHLIMALKYSYIFNNQKINRKEDFYFFRANLESAGNLVTAVSQVFNMKKDINGKYDILNLKYAQYLKAEGDFRYYNILGPSTLVYRASVGVGYAYGNSTALPFDKGFYSGGANGMRGWAIRSLGPGGYTDDTTSLRYDKMGDIFLETNLELRFPIIGWFAGAVFADAGNIWLLKPNGQYPDGEFKWDTFIRQVALDAGLGFRLDFSFFVFRLDGALQLLNPAAHGSGQWIKPGLMKASDVMWNFGIGFPF